MSFSLGIYLPKTDVRPTCFFQGKSLIEKLTSSQFLFFIRNPVLENRPLTYMTFTSVIQCLGVGVLFSRNPTSENQSCTNLGFFYRIFDVRKGMSGQCGFFIRNPASENRQWANVCFSVKIGRWKTDIHPTYYCSPNILRGTIVLGPVRLFVRPFVLPAYLSNHLLDFSEILHEVVLSERKKTDIFGFSIKIHICIQRGQKCSKCP